ncbi:PREDICTED: GH3 domain-containing protein-like isoform X3 [Priapulus caudatus]|uniref:GH3 domain-containing protein-like isoform X3 n=1 Tax=Priapulus caudatus TaxID=37621 RepID=A0ABM1EZA9_PRICU|nr:PREDICTED: GH3 domain-containing protein-like isoform X3 [Priapulus caudatus]
MCSHTTKPVYFIGCRLEKLLLKELRRRKNTEYGREHKFATITNRQQFVEQHPLTEYSHYEDLIKRTARGEVNVMLPDRPKLLGVTSGTTTGHSKAIPVDRAYVGQFFLKGLLPVFNVMKTYFPQSYGLQKSLQFTYSARWRLSEGNIPVGPASNPHSTGIDRLQVNYTTPAAAASITTEPEALYIHLLFGLLDPYVEKLEANFASIVYYAFVSLENNWSDLVTDIRLGRVNPDLNITDETRAELNKLLRPHPCRAMHLALEFERGFVGIARRVWHHALVVVCATSGASATYARALEERYTRGTPLYSPAYAATETLVGLNLWPKEEDPHYVLVPNITFYELIPLEAQDQEQPKTIFAEQAKVGESYELVITNMSGLYRYRFGDIVKVVRFFNECPVIEFLYRKGQLLNVRGEKTSEDSFYQALVHCAYRWHHCKVIDYTCCESVLMDTLQGNTDSSVPYYLVFVELGGAEARKHLNISTEQKHMLDDMLRTTSYVYESYRSKGSIGPMSISIVKPGSFHEFRSLLLTSTQASANQVKVPRVLHQTAYLQFMLDHVVVA